MQDLKRAAIIMLTLDKAAASRVLNHLPKDEMEMLTMEIARTDDVTRMEQDDAIQKFREDVDSRTVIERGSLELAGELLAQTIGEEGAEEILKNIRESMKSVPFGFLHKFKAEDVLSFITDEHPQTIAVIMSNLPTDLAADILKHLPPDTQLDVIRRVANMEQTAPEFIEDVEYLCQGWIARARRLSGHQREFDVEIVQCSLVPLATSLGCGPVKAVYGRLDVHEQGRGSGSAAPRRIEALILVQPEGAGQGVYGRGLSLWATCHSYRRNGSHSGKGGRSAIAWVVRQ